MHWIREYQLFLFDFDGLLVNTEEIHFKAYQKMCAMYGLTLDWTFERYCQAAHYQAEDLKNQIYAKFPELKVQEPSWEVLYAFKKKALVKLVQEGAVHMMPGAQKLLENLEKAGIKRCVVTHSPEDIVQAIRNQNPILNTIPHWITREHYTYPKPHPECYSMAIKRYGQSGDKVIGFEDTPRGLMALMAVDAHANLVCQAQYPEIATFIQKGARHYTSLSELADS